MLDNISHLRSLHDQFKEMGENIDNKELGMTLLASLPEDCKPLITALDAVGEADLSYEKVKNMLLDNADHSNNAKNSENAFSARHGNSASLENCIKPVKAQIRMKGEYFIENVTTVTRKDILCETTQSEIGSAIWLVLPVKAEKFKVLLIVLRNRILVINFLKRQYPFIHLMNLVGLTG